MAWGNYLTTAKFKQKMVLSVYIVFYFYLNYRFNRLLKKTCQEKKYMYQECPLFTTVPEKKSMLIYS